MGVRKALTGNFARIRDSALLRRWQLTGRDGK